MDVHKIETVIEFIKVAHANQYDKGGNEYWHHPVSVMKRLPLSATEDEMCIALLHDVLEDTSFTEKDMYALGMNEHVVSTVKMLSRLDKSTTYLDWIRSIANSGNRSAILVKIADNEDNSDPKRIAQLPESERDIVKRYNKSLKILREALEKIDYHWLMGSPNKSPDCVSD